MGSLSSRPKIPAPQPVFIQQAPPATPNPAPNTTSSDAGTTDIDVAETQGQVREQNLLQRGRGRFGTIRTGFRGLLTLANPDNQRRTLLGE